MKLSPLQVEGYYVKEASFSLLPDIEKDVVFSLTAGLQIQPASMINNETIRVDAVPYLAVNTAEPSRFRCELVIESRNDPSEKFPYTFRAVLVGYFKLIEELPEAEAAYIVATGAPGILYSAAREYLGTITGRGPCPGVQLPVVSFAPQPAKRKMLPAKATKKGGKRAGKKGAGKKGRK
ncbi:MAG TPA: hypothetical protein VK421_00915 [Pyrinomonadaceae bacterium]|nr:hypothetical protein [Pyrinomonadaceae bacterium]